MRTPLVIRTLERDLAVYEILPKTRQSMALVDAVLFLNTLGFGASSNAIAWKLFCAANYLLESRLSKRNSTKVNRLFRLRDDRRPH